MWNSQFASLVKYRGTNQDESGPSDLSPPSTPTSTRAGHDEPPPSPPTPADLRVHDAKSRELTAELESMKIKDFKDMVVKCLLNEPDLKVFAELLQKNQEEQKLSQAKLETQETRKRKFEQTNPPFSDMLTELTRLFPDFFKAMEDDNPVLK